MFNGGVMSRTLNFASFASAWISNGMYSSPNTPDVPPLNDRSTYEPSWMNGGKADLNPCCWLITDPTQG